MIRRVTVKNFKRFREQVFEFDLADSIVLAGPNNAGKSTLLQALAIWKFGVERWVAQREGSKAAKRSGVAVPRAEITAVPLREMNLLWEGRKVTGPSGMSGERRLIEIVVEGETDKKPWTCGIEWQYTNPETVYVRPWNAKDLDRAALQDFPPQAARQLDIIHIPPLSGIERDEPRRDSGMQNLLVGQGRPGEIVRNLLLEIAEREDDAAWQSLAQHMQELFGMELRKPSYSPAQPYILCEYRDREHSKLLDLANAGSGTLQVLLLFAFLYARPAAVILLDEPDAHQHIILQKQVYDLLRKLARERASQVIVATHSEAVLDTTEPTRVIGIFGGKPRRLASRVQRDQLREALKHITTTNLLLAGELGSVLYVESETDEKILKEWSRILNHPAQQFFSRPFVHHLRGRNLRAASAHFFALRAAYPELSAVCLLDGDNRDEPDEETGKSGLTVLRWQRHEIENYLLHPEAIKRFCNFPPLLNQQIDDEFWRQVPRGTDLFEDHVSLVRIRASEEFLVPLLASLNKETPKRNLYQLAAVMQADEIHPEACEKLDRIAEQLCPTSESHSDSGD